MHHWLRFACLTAFATVSYAAPGAKCPQQGTNFTLMTTTSPPEYVIYDSPGFSDYLALGNSSSPYIASFYLEGNQLKDYTLDALRQAEINNKFSVQHPAAAVFLGNEPPNQFYAQVNCSIRASSKCVLSCAASVLAHHGPNVTDAQFYGCNDAGGLGEYLALGDPKYVKASAYAQSQNCTALTLLAQAVSS